MGSHKVLVCVLVVVGVGSHKVLVCVLVVVWAVTKCWCVCLFVTSAQEMHVLLCIVKEPILNEFSCICNLS